MTYESGSKKGIPVSICGEMAGDSFFTALLIGIGVNILSMSTSRILKIKQFINSLNYKESKVLAESILKESSNEKIKRMLEDFNLAIKKII